MKYCDIYKHNKFKPYKSTMQHDEQQKYNVIEHTITELLKLLYCEHTICTTVH